jgi:hypothetical protein
MAAATTMADPCRVVTGEEINVIELVSQSWLFGINNGMKGRPSVFTMM